MIDLVAIGGFIAIVVGVGMLWGFAPALITGGTIALASSLLGAWIRVIATGRKES